jgi:hypothetical protein
MKTKTTNDPTFEQIAIIEKATGGLIKKYEWWVIKGVGESFISHKKPSHEEDIIYHGVLENSFVSKDGKYIGDFKRAHWYQKHRLKVYEPYAHGVAEAYTKDGKLEGYCGYAHRGAQVFKIKDRLFDETYKPKEEDYSSKQWAKWVKEYKDGITQAESEGDTWWANDIQNDGIGRYVTFKLRGTKVIETLEEAAQAAINLSNYLS